MGNSAKPIDPMLAALGFAPPTTNLVPKRRSGIYVLHLANERYYVGQSSDMPSRLASHRRTFPDLIQVSLLPLRGSKARLEAYEKEIIHTLEDHGFTLLNIVHASITHHSSPFDDLVTPDEQQQWLADPQRIGQGVRSSVDPNARMKYAARYARLQQRSDAKRLSTCLRRYVTWCLPKPASTEPAYWSVSCMPTTNAQTGSRLACFNSNVMEIFVVGYHK